MPEPGRPLKQPDPGAGWPFWLRRDPVRCRTAHRCAADGRRIPGVPGAKQRVVAESVPLSPGQPAASEYATIIGMSVLMLPDGRRLGWDESGDPTGTPVVYLHGTPQTRQARPADEELAGIRLIAFDRPGYG